MALRKEDVERSHHQPIAPARGAVRSIAQLAEYGRSSAAPVFPVPPSHDGGFNIATLARFQRVKERTQSLTGDSQQNDIFIDPTIPELEPGLDWRTSDWRSYTPAQLYQRIKNVTTITEGKLAGRKRDGVGGLLPTGEITEGFLIARSQEMHQHIVTDEVIKDGVIRNKRGWIKGFVSKEAHDAFYAHAAAAKREKRMQRQQSQATKAVLDEYPMDYSRIHVVVRGRSRRRLVARAVPLVPPFIAPTKEEPPPVPEEISIPSTDEQVVSEPVGIGTVPLPLMLRGAAEKHALPAARVTAAVRAPRVAELPAGTVVWAMPAPVPRVEAVPDVKPVATPEIKKPEVPKLGGIKARILFAKALLIGGVATAVGLVSSRDTLPIPQPVEAAKGGSSAIVAPREDPSRHITGDEIALVRNEREVFDSSQFVLQSSVLREPSKDPNVLAALPRNDQTIQLKEGIDYVRLTPAQIQQKVDEFVIPVFNERIVKIKKGEKFSDAIPVPQADGVVLPGWQAQQFRSAVVATQRQWMEEKGFRVDEPADKDYEVHLSFTDSDRERYAQSLSVTP